MKPLPWTLLASIAAALALAHPAAAAPDDPAPVLPGGECGGLVDVDCDDYNDVCTPEFPSCQHTFVRHCLVWYLYLDMTSPADLGRFGVCQDNPYFP
jgi:hypothetical protein